MTLIQTHKKLTIRTLDQRDVTALAQVAERDSRAVPRSPVIGAEIDGTLVAARSLADGSTVADPFRRTLEALELLEARAKQLGSRPKRSRRRQRRRRSRAALAGSPPGAGGRLIQLG